jgi:hypothetical protein
MNTAQEHTTPDGALRFIVSYDGVDTTLGFDGYEWHTHGDMLAAKYGLSEAAAIEQFLSDVVGGRAVIAISKIRGEDPAPSVQGRRGKGAQD